MPSSDDNLLLSTKEFDLDSPDLAKESAQLTDGAGAGQHVRDSGQAEMPPPSHKTGELENQWVLSESNVAVPRQGTGGPGPNNWVPESIGRYKILRTLGIGGFGVVYLAHDSDLERKVAIKVPRPDRFANSERLQSFVEEARKTAQLDHRSIVRVHDVQREPGGVYIVQQYIEGRKLSDYVMENSISSREIVTMMIAVVESVGYAHRRDIIHRDLKPANIIVDRDGHPHVTDFGLALELSDRELAQAKVAGTVPYMSPEQAQGESHRLDPRSDIWALGVVLYKLLGKRLPFGGDSREKLLNAIDQQAPMPLDQLDQSIPQELSRICLRCLQKRAIDRYQTTEELCQDLTYWLNSSIESNRTPAGDGAGLMQLIADAEMPGLRPLDQRHSAFFQALLPGSSDRFGTSQCVAFWKKRIEQRESELSFLVGLIYGPSGSGKTSLVRAGILPSVSDKRVACVFVEADSGSVTAKIGSQLRRACPELAEQPRDLIAQINYLRTGKGARGRKVCIVIDQFEQFLHANNKPEFDRLVRALRQCNGSDVQALILVRDDFYVSLNRFFQELEIPILEGVNCALVDRFDSDHARRVLISLGRAYGKITAVDNLPLEQSRFINLVVNGLAEQDGMVVCVRLTAFAEMMRNRQWDIKNLKAVGGLAGIGRAFLDEKFCRSTTPLSFRLHQSAAKNVLRALVSEGGLKGPVMSYQQLLSASGYANRPADFDSLMNILDRELRIVSPVESVSMGCSDDDHLKHYQLAHDYLVHSIHDWLLAHQKLTRKGRAELKLAECSSEYSAKPDLRRLPRLIDFVRIMLFTKRIDRTQAQNYVLHQATKYYASRLLLIAVLFLVVGVFGKRMHDQSRSDVLVSQLLLASDWNDIQECVLTLKSNPYAILMLKESLVDSPNSQEERLRQINSRIALMQIENLYFKDLQNALTDPTIPLEYTEILQKALLGEWKYPERTAFGNHLRSNVFRDTRKPDAERFRAGLALAFYDASTELWSEQDYEFLARQMIMADADDQSRLRVMLKPIQSELARPLTLSFVHDDLSESQRISVAKTLVSYSEDEPSLVAGALAAANSVSFEILFESFSRSKSRAGIETLRKIVSENPSGTSQEKLRIGRRRAGAAIALLRLNEFHGVAHVFNVKDNPESLTQFVHGCRSRRIRLDQIVDCFQGFGISMDSLPDRKQETSLIGLLLSMAEYAPTEIDPQTRVRVEDTVDSWYENHPSSGVHGAAGWLLRRWGRYDVVSRIDRTPIDYSAGREWYTIQVATRDRPLYFTFIVFEAGTYFIGSREDAVNGKYTERPHPVIIERAFAILDREVTRLEYETLCNTISHVRNPKTREMAIGRPNWYDAVTYCRRLGESWGIREGDQPYADPRNQKGNPPDPSPHAKGAPRNWQVNRDAIGFRLPTESEWEIACRAGMQTTWYFGDDILLADQYASLDHPGHRVEKRVALTKTLRPNLRGMFDMIGNRSEWCHDWWGGLSVRPVVDKGGASDGAERVLRGGSIWDSAVSARSAIRLKAAPATRDGANGFRLVIRPMSPAPNMAAKTVPNIAAKAAANAAIGN